MRKVALILLLALPVFAGAQNSWEKKEAFGGDKRSRSVSFSIGNRGYVACGEDTADQMHNDLWEYDPGTDSWMQRATLPAVGRRDAVGFAIGSKGYVGTGIDAAESAFGNNLQDWWEYSPATNTWLQRANCPLGASWGGIYFATGFVNNGIGYVLCGKLGNSNYTSQMYAYNPSTNIWTVRANFPGGTRYAMTAMTINGRSFAGLGTDENILQTDWYEYLPSSNTWQAKTAFPGTGRFAAVGFAIGPKGYMLGGSDGGYKDELWQYDPPSDTWWVKAPFDSPRRSMSVFVIANAAYAGTGHGLTGKRRDFWQYQQYLTGEEEIAVAETKVYPNPAVDQLTIAVPSSEQMFPENALLSIISAEGKLILQQDVSNQSQVNINVMDYRPGVYLVQISNDNWYSQTSFIKK